MVVIRGKSNPRLGDSLSSIALSRNLCFSHHKTSHNAFERMGIFHSSRRLVLDNRSESEGENRRKHTLGVKRRVHKETRCAGVAKCFRCGKEVSILNKWALRRCTPFLRGKKQEAGGAKMKQLRAFEVFRHAGG